MRSLERNKQTLYYALYGTKIIEYEKDEDGNILYVDINGVQVPIEKSVTTGYSTPVKFRANISAGKGDSETAVFGTSLDFTRTISSCDMTVPIKQTSLVWYETIPVLNADGTANKDSADYSIAAPIAKSLNSLTIALKAITKNEVE